MEESAPTFEVPPDPPPKLLRPRKTESLLADLKPIIEQIELTRVRIDDLSPPGSMEEADIQPQLDAYYTFHTNAIEGNRLTEMETAEVLRGATIDGKPLQDSLEARNLAGALETARKLLQKKVPFDQRALLSLHSLVLRGILDAQAGNLRTVPREIGGNPIQPPEPYLIQDYLDEMWWWLRHESKTLHPVIAAAIAHWWLMRIHPFYDGNGRVGRLMFYFMLARAGYRLEPVIMKEDRFQYYDALAAADNGNIAKICSFIAQAVLRAMRSYEERLLTQKRTRDAIGPELVKLRAKVEKQQVDVHEIWKSGMLAAQREFRFAGDEVAKAVGGVTISIEDLGVLSFDEWRELRDGGQVQDQWFFIATIQMPARSEKYVFWFSPHPGFVRDAAHIGQGIGLNISRRSATGWDRLHGPGKPTLRHLFMKERLHCAHVWIAKQESGGPLPVRQVELRSTALSFFTEALSEALSR